MIDFESDLNEFIGYRRLSSQSFEYISQARVENLVFSVSAVGVRFLNLEKVLSSFAFINKHSRN